MSKGKWRHYKSDDDTKKTNFIGIKVSNQERSKLEQLAIICNLKLSEYIVASSLYINDLKIIACREELDKLSDEINSIGVNLNQTAKALNTLAKSSSQSSNITIHNSLKEIERIRTQINKTCRELGNVFAKLEPNRK